MGSIGGRLCLLYDALGCRCEALGTSPLVKDTPDRNAFMYGYIQRNIYHRATAWRYFRLLRGFWRHPVISVVGIFRFFSEC